MIGKILEAELGLLTNPEFKGTGRGRRDRVAEKNPKSS